MLKVGQINSAGDNVEGKAHFGTHQGVKGLEFPRVMIIMDDHQARGFTFKYDKLFSHIQEDTQTAQTRRLFYVTSSRAQRSLALVAYAQNPIDVKTHLLENNWLRSEEVFLSLPF